MHSTYILMQRQSLKRVYQVIDNYIPYNYGLIEINTKVLPMIPYPCSVDDCKVWAGGGAELPARNLNPFWQLHFHNKNCSNCLFLQQFPGKCLLPPLFHHSASHRVLQQHSDTLSANCVHWGCGYWNNFIRLWFGNQSRIGQELMQRS